MAEDFSRTGVDITLSDIDIKRAEKAAEPINADATVFDTRDHQAMVETLKQYDLVLGALPGDYGYRALEACVEVGTNTVDVSFTPENPMDLDMRSREKDVTIIPDCGVAPGLSNLLVGYGASKLDRVDEAKIMVGGIPEEPVPPLGYTLTWSADGLIDEYIRDVTIVRDGEKVQTPALSGLEVIEFPGVGELEAFYTDGLRTLVDSFPNVRNLYEKTLRYPGHVEKVKLLRDLGFFSEDPVSIQGELVAPKQVSARLFERSLVMPDVGDLLAMLIRVSGVKDGENQTKEFTVLEYYDHETDTSAMARTTAYTASIVAAILADDGIKEKGVIPMERLGSDHGFVDRVFKELEKRDVSIDERVIT